MSSLFLIHWDENVSLLYVQTPVWCCGFWNLKISQDQIVQYRRRVLKYKTIPQAAETETIFRLCHNSFAKWTPWPVLLAASDFINHRCSRPRSVKTWVFRSEVHSVEPKGVLSKAQLGSCLCLTISLNYEVADSVTTSLWSTKALQEWAGLDLLQRRGGPGLGGSGAVYIVVVGIQYCAYKPKYHSTM